MIIYSSTLPGKFHEQKSLAGNSPWGCKQLDTTEHTHTHTHIFINYVDNYVDKNFINFFRHTATAHNSLQYSINVTFIWTGKPRKICVTHFIAIFTLLQ